MRSTIASLAVLALVLTLAPMPARAQEDTPGFDGVERREQAHRTSTQLGEAANQEGAQFKAGMKTIVEPFIVVGKTTAAGVSYLVLRGAQGIVWVKEEGVIGLKYAYKGAKFVVIKTAQGIKWVAVKAIEATEAVFNFAVEVGTLVIDGVEYVLVKVGDGFAYLTRQAIKLGHIVANGVEYVLVQLSDGIAFVAKKAVQAGKLVIDGVEYVAQKTADGIVYVASSTWDFIKDGAAWTRDTFMVAGIRARLSGAMLVGGISDSTLNSFQSLAATGPSERVRNAAADAFAACASFNMSYKAH